MKTAQSTSEKENCLVIKCNLSRYFIAQELQQDCGFCAFFRISLFYIIIKKF